MPGAVVYKFQWVSERLAGLYSSSLPKLLRRKERKKKEGRKRKKGRKKTKLSSQQSSLCLPTASLPQPSAPAGLRPRALGRPALPPAALQGV